MTAPRKQYRAGQRQHRIGCICGRSIMRGMPVVFVNGRPVHASCEWLADPTMTRPSRDAA